MDVPGEEIKIFSGKAQEMTRADTILFAIV
jgi:hypothetical protein